MQVPLINNIGGWRILIIFLLILVGCYNASNLDYKERIKKIPSYLVEHFPEELTYGENSTLITNTDTTSKCIFYMLFQYGDKAIQRFIIKGNEHIIGKFWADDIAIVSVKREIVSEWNPKKEIYYKDTTIKYSLPVPYFENEDDSSRKGQGIYSETTNCGLSDDFMIYVYNFEIGKFWDGLAPQEYMPKGWQNGFSKGVAVSKSKNVVIYWFVVW